MAKLKLNYKPRKYAPRDHHKHTGKALLEYRAIEYARWLAQRDGVALPSNCLPRVLNVGRPNAVMFGDVRINIPNHDWTPRVEMGFGDDD
jgi:hypothetical protein